MHKLVLIRHGESEWNKLNLFTGWTDVELSEKGVEEAHRAGRTLKEKGYDPISQLKGYIISGDLGYISNYKKSRNKVGKIDRDVLAEVLLRNYLR